MDLHRLSEVGPTGHGVEPGLVDVEPGQGAGRSLAVYGLDPVGGREVARQLDRALSEAGVA